MGRDAGRDHALAHVVDIGQPQMLGRRHIAQEIGAGRRRNRAANRAGNVIVAGRDVAGQRPEHIERRAPADALLELHVGFDLIERHMSRAFDHHLHADRARALGQLAHHQQLADLPAIGRVAGGAGTQPVADRDRHVMLAQISHTSSKCS